VKRASALVAAAALALTAGPALADSPARQVVITGSVADSPTLRRLEAELRAVDLAPVFAREAGAEDKPPREIMRRHNAQALIVLGEAGRVTAIHLERDVPGTHRVTPAASGGEGPDISLLRAVELLRAELMPLPSSPDEPGMDRTRARPIGPRGTVDLPGDTHPWRLRLAAGPTFSPGGILATGHLWLIPALRALDWLEVELSLVFPLGPATVEEAEGSADVHIGLATAGVRFLPWRERWRLRPSLSLGVGAILVHMQGTAAAGYEDGEDWVASFAGAAGGGLSLRLPWRLWVQLDALVGVALPRPAVGFAGRTAATWGQPFVNVNLGLGVRL